MDIQTLYYVKYRNTFRLGTYIALLKTMSIAHLVEQLYGNSQLNQQTYERLSKTRDFIKTIISSGIDSEQSRATFSHINRVHANLPASNDDFLYVLSTFILEPVRFNRQFSRYQLADDEIDVLLTFWSEVGQRMRITDIPETEGQWHKFQRAYEAKCQAYSPEGNALAKKSLNQVVKLSLPFGTRFIAKQLITGALSVNTLAALGLNKPRIPANLSARVLIVNRG
ncbi:oxygenase MpaB family protein [Thalassotalea fusca]